MILIDANLLLYATNIRAPEHTAANAWLKGIFAGTETIALSWVVLWAFLRVSTNRKIWTQPKTPAEAFAIVREWLAQPGVVVVQPGARHAELLEELLITSRTVGPLVTDAALAALAIENGATLASTDRDFRRFKGLRWVNPLD